MYDLPDNTLALYTANPLGTPFNFASVPGARLAQEVASFRASPAGKLCPHPESDALSFYFLNHAFHLVAARHHDLERLPKDIGDVLQTHLVSTANVAKRLIYYTLVACIEEAVFLPPQNAAFWEHISSSFGKDIENLFRTPTRGGISTAGSGYLTFGKLDTTAGDLTTALMSVFAFGKWNPGYGGRGWTPIASLLADVVHGRISMEQFGDQAFSLEHNGGCMFNKGHFYGGYSSTLNKILNTQDAGQIPQMIGTDTGVRSFVSPELARAHATMARHYPQEIGGKVDSALVHDSERRRAASAAMKAKKMQAFWANQQAASPVDPLTSNQKQAMAGKDILLGSMPGFK